MLNIVRAVAFDGEAAAFGGSLWTEGCEDEMAAWLQGLAQHVEVAFAIVSVDRESALGAAHTKEQLVEGARRSTLEELTDWTLWADKTLTF